MAETDVRNDDISAVAPIFKRSRYLLGGLLLLLAGLSCYGVLDDRLDGVLPALSPFTGILTAMGQRLLPPFLMLCIPILLLSVLRRRWFCSHACPTGLILDIAGRARRSGGRRASKFPKLNRWFLFLAIGGAVAGYPLFVWLDPLSILNAFFSALHRPATLLTILPAAGLLVLVAICVWRPYLWCARLCPLGALQELLRSVAVARAGKQKTPQALKDRRVFLGLLAGGACGGLVRYLSSSPSVIRPPGASPESRFSSLCVRCGTCVSVCPERIILPDLGKSGIAGLMTPALTIGSSYCSELCNECGKNCPTNAIARSSLEDKQNIAIGMARVIKPLCLSWEKHEFCMKCGDFCPYDAVIGVDKHGVKCPEVIGDKCRGCGACQVVCPVQHPVAIVVKTVPQRRLSPVQVRPVKDLIEHMVS